MRISDDRYTGLVNMRIKLMEDCYEVDTLKEFVETYGEKYSIDDDNVEDGIITIDDDSDIYTIEETEWGLEVSDEVEILDLDTRSTVIIRLND